MILGIISLAAIAVALMPSPGNFLHPPAETTIQTPAQYGLTSDPVIDPANQTSIQPVTPPTTQPATETVPKTVYTNVTIVPENVTVAVNQTFSVDVWINNVTGMAGWEINLLWNSGVLKCVQAQVNTPPEWGGAAFDWFNKTAADVDPKAVYTAWQFGQGVMSGQYFKAEVFGPRGSAYHNTFSGSLAIVTLTFQALHAGSTSLDLWRGDWNNISMSYEGIEIGDGNAMPITYSVYSGFVEVRAP